MATVPTPAEVEICVWVDGSQKWISGVNRKTTCHDLIRALLKTQSSGVTDEEVMRHIIVERWKRVEKPLDHEQRILKVWKSWGDSVHSVRFSLRKGRSDDTSQTRRPVDDCAHETESCGGRSERSRRRHKMRVSRREATATAAAAEVSATSTLERRHSKNGYTSPSLLSENSDDRGATVKQDRTEIFKSAKDDPRFSETMERLMRLVVAQGETIQNQLKRLNQRESQIETYEQQMHLLRVQNLGNDYLLSSYLQDQSNSVAPKQQQNLQETPHQSTQADGRAFYQNVPQQSYGAINQTGQVQYPHGNRLVDAEGRILGGGQKLPSSSNPGMVDYQRTPQTPDNVNTHIANISEEKSNDSGIVVNEECLNFADEKQFWEKDASLSTEEVEEHLQMLSKIEDVISKLIHEEEVIQGLSSTLEVIQTQQKLETNELEDDLKRAGEHHATLVAEARANEQQIRVLDTSSTQKKKLIDALLQEEIDSDQETRALQAHLDYIIHLPPTAFRLAEEGDDPPPLYPPPVYPVCLVQPLFGHQPPQLVHASNPATTKETSSIQSTKDSNPATSKSREASPSLHPIHPSSISSSLITPKSNAMKQHSEAAPENNTNPISSNFSVPKNGLTAVKVPQNNNKLSYDRNIINRSSIRNSQRKVASNLVATKCSQCSDNVNSANFNMNNSNNNMSSSTVNKNVVLKRTYLENNINSILCMNCSNNNKKQASLIPDNQQKSQKTNANNNIIKSLSTNTETVDVSSSDDDSPPPLPQCPPPMLDSTPETGVYSPPPKTTPFNNKYSSDSKKFSYHNNTMITLPTLNSGNNQTKTENFLSSMPIKCRSSTSSDSSTTNSSTSSTTTFPRLSKAPNDTAPTAKTQIVNGEVEVSVRGTKIGGKKEDSVDSNSDTGLSSLHSSSDEGFGTLDTLV